MTIRRVRKVFKTEAERFWPKVDKHGPVPASRPELGPCWVWTGGRIPNGYGHFSLTQLPGTPKQRILAHRWVYEEMTGPIPEGLEIDHLCRNRACVNPVHLELVTHQMNGQRGIAGAVSTARQKAKTHCPQGHEYSPENTWVSPEGHRQCRVCDRDRKRAKAMSRLSQLDS
jgi:hypothetical protein